MTNLGFDTSRLDNITRHFTRYVDDGRLPGWQIQISRRGTVAYRESYGMRDVESQRPVDDGTVFRIYSMTKPITSVGAMILYEEGRFDLTDPVSRYIPALAHMRVLTGGPALKPVTRPAAEPIRVVHLLNHTSGLTYGFHHIHVQDELYRNAGFEWGVPTGSTLEECVAAWARLPLRFDPGTCWNYSVSTDVLGRLIEVLSGQNLAEFLRERIFQPLGMVDTSFSLRGDMQQRLAAMYIPTPDGHIARSEQFNGLFSSGPQGEVTFLSGGGGLLSTTADYHRFSQMLLRCGELDGQRILGSRTVRYMTTNSLPGGQDLAQFGIPLFAETSFAGVGFGLGVSVLENPMAAGVLGSKGQYGWGGAASTEFWVDPLEDLTCIFMTQLLPSSTYPIRRELRQLVYAALVD